MERASFSVILMLYLIVASLFAVRTPPWQAPDEPAHYNYVAQVAQRGCCPLIEMGDWQSAYQSQLTTERFRADLLDRLSTIQYEDHQPPLYYLLASVPYRLFGGDLYALRLFSVALGAFVVVGTYYIGRMMFPSEPWIALGAMALVAFLPQHVAVLASVNNDALAEALIVLALAAVLHYLQDERPSPLWLGVIVGLGFLTKASTYFLAGILGVAIFLRWWRHSPPRPMGALIRAGALFLLPALLLGGIWWGRNIAVYGFPDFLGLGAHDVVVADQPRAADWIAELGWGDYLNRAVHTTFKSFWGQFGWMALPLDNVLGGRIYPLFLGLMLLAGVGIVLRAKKFQKIDVRWIILILTLFLAIIAYIYYNTEFVQFQGRYLFPGLVPFALLMARGIATWWELWGGRWPNARWLSVFVWCSLALLDLYLLERVIVPGLSVSLLTN